MHKILDWVKGHPKTAGGIFVGLLLLLVLLLRGGSSSSGSPAVVTVQPTNTAANTALQAQQLAAQVQTNATNQAAAVQLAGINAAQTVQSQQSTDATNVALSQISTTADTTKYVAGLQASVAQGQTDAAVKINDSQMSAATQIATISANSNQALANITSEMNANNNATSLSLADIMAQVTNKQTDASQTVALAGINANYNLGVVQSNNQLAGVNSNNSTLVTLANIKAGSIANAINIASADQWGGGFVNPGIAAFLANG